MTKKTEILAPGGDSYAVKAAILAGADAVYCGLPSFNARQRAENITLKELGNLVRIADSRGCKIYLTLNTVILDSEFPVVVDIINQATALGIHAVIVQDPGLLYILKEYFPSLEVHASTQMTTHNAGQLEFLSRLNIAQVNLSRELSLDEIRYLCDAGHSLDLKIEVFVHGAYCISFSGQCYMSSVMCGLSGNRGACVQPCRRLYSLPGKNRTGAPFNLKDNSAFSSAGELVNAGIDSIKIEGRIKDYIYVYTVVSAWRKQIDGFLLKGNTKKTDDTLGQVFNRSFTDGYLKSRIQADMFAETSRDQSLVPVSVITDYFADEKILTLEDDAVLDPETQVIIYTYDFTFICRGTVLGKTAKCKYRLHIDHILKGKISKGQILYRIPVIPGTSDLKSRIDTLDVIKKPLFILIKGAEGNPLDATFTTGGRSASVRTESLLSKATSATRIEDIITEKIGQLGNTDFILEDIDFSGLEQGMFIPVKEINELRRKGINALIEKKSPSVNISVPGITCEPVKPHRHPSIKCLISSAEDIHLKNMKNMTLLYELPVSPGARSGEITDLFNNNRDIIPWFPSILIGDDFADAADILDRIDPPYIITDNTGVGIEASKRGIEWIAGPMLNCTNSYALRCLQKYAGCSGAFLSNELSAGQAGNICPPDSFSLWYNVYHPVLLMNTRQCVLRNCVDCGKEVTDRSCLVECDRQATVYDNNHNPYYIVKRPGHYNQVYHGKHRLNLNSADECGDIISSFVIDLRNIPSETKVNSTKEELLESFLSWAGNETGSHARLKNIFRNINTGQDIN